MGRLAVLGTFFAVDCGPVPEARGFRPVAELYGPGLDALVDRVGARLGTGPDRIAASTAQFGIAARLWSLALGPAVLAGTVPDLGPERVWWRQPAGGSLEFALPDPRPVPGRPAEVLDRVVSENLGLLDAEVRARYGVSPKVLRGNASSSVAAALTQLGSRFPDAPHSPAELGTALLTDGPFAGTGTFVHEPGLGSAYVRNSCCLYYRAPGGGPCGDCVLRTRRAARA